MNEPPKRRDEPIINRYMYNQIGCMAVFTVALCIGFLKLPVFARLCSAGTSQTYFMTMFFALFVFAGIFNSFNARTYRMNLLSHLRENRAFLLIMGMVFVRAESDDPVRRNALPDRAAFPLSLCGGDRPSAFWLCRPTFCERGCFARPGGRGPCNFLLTGGGKRRIL